jgi:transcriptional regulator with XRE-family HTH domain
MSPLTLANPLPTIGRQIRHYRREAAMSQEDLAEKSGIYRTYLSRIENGVANPSIMVLATIACTLNVQIQSLMAAPEG